MLVTLSGPRRRHVLCYLRHHDAGLVTYDRPNGEVSLEPLPGYTGALLEETLRAEHEALPRGATLSDDPSSEG